MNKYEEDVVDTCSLLSSSRKLFVFTVFVRQKL